MCVFETMKPIVRGIILANQSDRMRSRGKLCAQHSTSYYSGCSFLFKSLAILVSFCRWKGWKFWEIENNIDNSISSEIEELFIRNNEIMKWHIKTPPFGNRCRKKEKDRLSMELKMIYANWSLKYDIYLGIFNIMRLCIKNLIKLLWKSVMCFWLHMNRKIK